MTPESIEKTAETVHFCGAAQRRASQGRFVVGLRMGRVFLYLLLASWLVATIRTPLGYLIGVACVVWIGIHSLSLLTRLLAPYWNAARGCDAPTHDSRLASVGNRRKVESIGELADVLFEPAIFRAPFFGGFEKGHDRTALFAGIVMIIVCALTVLRLGLGGAFAASAHYYLAAGIGLALLVHEWLSPTYLRIVPGRVDVMEFGVFLRGRARVTKYDLRTARVVVDLRQLAVFIDDNEKNVHAELAIAFVRDRYRLAYYLLLAALSTHEPGPLPDDALVG